MSSDQRQFQIVSRTAMSLIEVMVAMTILAVGILGIMSGISTIESVNRESQRQQSTQDVMLAIKTRLENCPWSDLRSASAPWSYGRYVAENAVNVIRPLARRTYDQAVPMTEDATMGENCLLPRTRDGSQEGLGILSAPSGLENLRVYVEWYRGNSYDVDGSGEIGTGEEGFFSNPGLSLAEEVLSGVSVAPAERVFLPYLEHGRPSELMDQQTGLLIRIVVLWGSSSGASRRETIISRRVN